MGEGVCEGRRAYVWGKVCVRVWEEFEGVRSGVCGKCGPCMIVEQLYVGLAVLA